MAPRHFWWLVETLEAKRGPNITNDEKTAMLDLLRRAERGEF